MENDFCQNHLYHNYNMLITYFIKEVDYGSRMKSRLQDTWKGRWSLTPAPCSSWSLPSVPLPLPSTQSSLLSKGQLHLCSCLDPKSYNCTPFLFVPIMSHIQSGRKSCWLYLKLYPDTDHSSLPSLVKPLSSFN